MRRVMILFVALLGLLLTACAPATTPTASVQPQPAATVQPPAAATAVQPTTAPQATEAAQPAKPTAPAATPDMDKVLNPQPDDHKLGPDGAPVTIIEWSDFQCPYCSVATPLLKQLATAYPKDVQIIYRHFPLPSHDKSLPSTEAAEAAAAQGKFWEMEELLFKNQEAWSGQTKDDFRKTLSQYAQEIGLDVKKFDEELDGGKYSAKAKAAQDLAVQLQIPGTPFLLLNGSQFPQGLNYLAYPDLEGVVKYIVELPKKQYKEAPAMQIDQAKEYIATIKTDQGDIVVKLFADKAPLAVNNFVFLAKNGWYDGVTFHRVLPDFMAQGGDPTGLGMGDPGYSFPNEVTGLKFDKEGLLAMANAGPDTNGSQFFITYGPAAQLDAADPTKEANYTIFGEVISGMDVAKKLKPRDPQQKPDFTGSVIETITIAEK
jgi:cyclophilin family peptidyl-prolyl cis-trans isomerase/protein-disulfide isomerase